MRTICILGMLFYCSALGAQTINQSTTNPSAIPAPTPATATLQDGSSTIWQQTTYEQAPDGSIVPYTHQYTELATGLNHLVNGQWVGRSIVVDETTTNVMQRFYYMKECL